MSDEHTLFIYGIYLVNLQGNLYSQKPIYNRALSSETNKIKHIYRQINI